MIDVFKRFLPRAYAIQLAYTADEPLSCQIENYSVTVTALEIMNKYLLAIIALLALTTQPTRAAETTAPTDDDATTYIMKEINAYRASLGLSAVQTSDETCNFAKIRAHEIVTNFSHEGFHNRQKAGTLPYTHWTVTTENLAMTSDYKQVETLWKNSPGHAKNMRADTPYVCVIQYGKYFAYVGMKP